VRVLGPELARGLVLALVRELVRELVRVLALVLELVPGRHNQLLLSRSTVPPPSPT